MSQNWYPIIDEIICSWCVKCIEKCKQGVYDVARKPHPVVIAPKNCVEGCHGCGNICPTGAITFHGENIDWTPLKKGGESASCCCGG